MPDGPVPFGQRAFLTFDQDWAPDWATHRIVDVLVRHGLSGTFFVTHQSPVLATLRSVASGTSRIELGLHPNFLPGSSHGSSQDDVLAHLRDFVPEAVGARAHCLIQGTPTLQAYRRAGLAYDAATLRDGQPDLSAFRTWTGLWDIPIWFEDDVHLERRRSCDLDALGLDTTGLRVMTFHPVLVALDCRSLEPYVRLKAWLGSQGLRLQDASPSDFDAFREVGGVGTLFNAVAVWLEAHPDQAGKTLSTLATIGSGY